MRWKGRRESENVEDQRGTPPARLMVGGGLGTLILIVVAVLFGADPAALLNLLQQNAPPAPQGAPAPGQAGAPNPEDDERKQFVSVVLADTEDVWTDLFRAMGRSYKEPKLVLFSNQVSSACGLADAAVGPFYCPGDEKVYLDLAFFDELKQRFKAPGDFAQAYVIAHEIGHHVQNQLGISENVSAQRRRLSPEQYNRLSVRLELQADFLAGVWAHHAQASRQILESGDVEEALAAANAIGDDRLQRQAQGYVVPDSFTHGTSAQRVRWFRRGLQTGELSQGDTFNTDDDEL